MNSRKIMRNGMRKIAELRGFKPSKYVHETWEKFQISLFGGGDKGVKMRAINQAKGTHHKKNWRTRVESAIG